MPKPIIVLDFDGTLTDSEAESAPYLDAYASHISQHLGISADDYTALLRPIVDEIRANPASGWTIDGHIVAPATSDVAALNAAANLELMRRLSSRTIENSLNGLPDTDEDRFAMANQTHIAAYKRAGIAFREGAACFAAELRSKYEVVIVTNSQTEAVQKKLTLLAAQSGIIGLDTIPIVGDAQKYKIDTSWDRLPPTITPDGFPLPISLRRKKYASTLESLASNPDRAAIVGDNCHLDLATPLALGYRAILTRTPAAAPHEIEYVRSHPRGFFAETYRRAADWLKTQFE